MNDREKLIEMLESIGHAQRLYPDLYVDMLIDNGVVVQRWIPVTERLPEDEAEVLVCHKNGFVTDNARFGTHWWFADDQNPITHWMPLPEPPKEGE